MSGRARTALCAMLIAVAALLTWTILLQLSTSSPRPGVLRAPSVQQLQNWSQHTASFVLYMAVHNRHEWKRTVPDWLDKIGANNRLVLLDVASEPPVTLPADLRNVSNLHVHRVEYDHAPGRILGAGQRTVDTCHWNKASCPPFSILRALAVAVNEASTARLFYIDSCNSPAAGFSFKPWLTGGWYYPNRERFYTHSIAVSRSKLALALSVIPDSFATTRQWVNADQVLIWLLNLYRAQPIKHHPHPHGMVSSFSTAKLTVVRLWLHLNRYERNNMLETPNEDMLRVEQLKEADRLAPYSGPSDGLMWPSRKAMHEEADGSYDQYMARALRLYSSRGRQEDPVFCRDKWVVCNDASSALLATWGVYHLVDSILQLGPLLEPIFLFATFISRLSGGSMHEPSYLCISVCALIYCTVCIGVFCAICSALSLGSIFTSIYRRLLKTNI